MCADMIFETYVNTPKLLDRIKSDNFLQKIVPIVFPLDLKLAISKSREMAGIFPG